MQNSLTSIMLSFRVRVFGVLALFLVAFGCVGIGSAQAFSVSPVVVDLEVAPGQAGQGKIDIVNDGDARRTYFVSVQKFVAKGEEGQQEFLPETDTSGIASWITPQQRSIALEPGERAAFTYAVSVPQNAEPGGHYAAVFFSDRPGSGQDSSVGVGAKVGVLFLLRVPGNITEEARVESFRSNADRLSHLPAYFELRIRNLGNVHLHPEGSIVIRDIFGSIVAKVQANPRQAAVLPNSIRRLDPAWAKTFEEVPPGAFSELRNEWRNFGIGRYTAEVQATYGGQKEPLTATATFWVIPWQLLCVVAFGILLFIILMKLYNKMVVRSALRKSSRS